MAMYSGLFEVSRVNPCFCGHDRTQHPPSQTVTIAGTATGAGNDTITIAGTPLVIAIGGTNTVAQTQAAIVAFVQTLGPSSPLFGLQAFIGPAAGQVTFFWPVGQGAPGFGPNNWTFTVATTALTQTITAGGANSAASCQICTDGPPAHSFNPYPAPEGVARTLVRGG